MNNLKELFKKRWVQVTLYILLGLFLGWILFGGGSETKEKEETTVKTEKEKKRVWTCSMHPQIKMDKPGKCPICGMDLIPLVSSDKAAAVIDPNAVQLSEEAAALANIQTTEVGARQPLKEIQLYGTIQPDERSQQVQTAHVGGRIENLLVNFTGESVKKGKVLAIVYSPELYNAQEELLEAVKMKGTQPRLLDAAREKLRLLKLTDDQISSVERTGRANPYVEIKANTSGIVVAKRVSKGDYVAQGAVLFEVANLSQLWAMFEAYEADLPFLKVGGRVAFTVQAIPGKTFTGSISFIDPVIDRTTRTAKVRVEISNPGMVLKPEMFATATVKVDLASYKNSIVVPKSAVLWTGRRSIVYVKDQRADSPVFMLREVKLGPSLGNAYVILDGLEAGEHVVTNGVFTIDASAQLEGKRSMMNTDHSNVSSHSSHGGEDQVQLNEEEAVTKATIKVQGLCDMCKSRIETAAMGVKGVKSASWDSGTKQMSLVFNPNETSIATVSKAIARVGHDAGAFKATNAAYEKLPECCRYREK